MAKRIISLILASVMLLSMTSCSKKEKKIAYQEGMTLEEYIDKVELPKNLTVSIDPATIFDGETVCVYENVKYVDVDDELLIEKLLHNPVTEESASAAGRQYVAQTNTISETVVAHDGGEACFGIRGEGLDGGFSYIYHDLSEKDDVINLIPEVPAELYYSSSYMDHLYDFYQSAGETLEFATRDEIENTFLSLFENLGLPTVEVQEMVAYNLDTLNNIYTYNENAHKRGYEWMLEHSPEDISAPQNYEEIYPRPQKSNETYVVFGRQLIDGIPIDNYWTTDSEEVKSGGQTLYFQYTADGLLRGNISCIVEQPDSTNGKEIQIVNASAVLEGVNKYYGEAILLEPHDIESMELLYREYWTEDSVSVDLKPCWLVRVSYPLTISDEENGQVVREREVKATDHLYFDAVTGELLPESISPKVE